jgi:hypothetical protein
MAEHDRHDELLNDDQAVFVVEAAEDLVQELGDEAFAAIEAKAQSPATGAISINAKSGDVPITARVLCIPLRDQADETASHMLAQLLVAEGFDVATESAKATTGELVDRVAESKCELVVISIVPPIGPRDTRLLWRRLRHHFPELPIVMGFWSGAASHDDLGLSESDSATKIATTLAEAVTLTRAMAAQLKLTVKTA